MFQKLWIKVENLIKVCVLYMIMYINMCMLSIMLGAIGMYVPVVL